MSLSLDKIGRNEAVNYIFGNLFTYQYILKDRRVDVLYFSTYCKARSQRPGGQELLSARKT